jgi:hypothetical protein
MRQLSLIGALFMALTASSALAQKQGGTLHMPHPDSPGSMSIFEE